jgi:hypothetical protein
MPVVGWGDAAAKMISAVLHAHVTGTFSPHH